MSVYTEISFQKYKDLTYVIHPQSKENTTGAGYDLRVGYFLKIKDSTIVEEGEGADQNEEKKNIILEPLSSLLIITRERVYLSRTVVGKMHARATYAGQGIVINSTTVDPRWNGRMVFLLTNISNKNTKVSLSDHFCTISLHTVKHLSSSNPNDPRKVLIKYTKEYDGDISNAQEYLLETGADKIIYDEKRHKCINNVNRGRLYIALISNKEKIQHIGKISLIISLILFLLISPFYINYENLLGIEEMTIFTFSAIGTLILVAIKIYSTIKERK